MPSTLTYPGVYIEEVPSGVRDDHGRSHLDHGFHRGDDRRGAVDEPLTMQQLWRTSSAPSADWPRICRSGYAVQGFLSERRHAGR